MAALPALAEQLEVEAAAAHGGGKHPHPARGLLTQLQRSVVAADILHIHPEQQSRTGALGRHSAVHLLKITGQHPWRVVSFRQFTGLGVILRLHTSLRLFSERIIPQHTTKYNYKFADLAKIFFEGIIMQT